MSDVQIGMEAVKTQLAGLSPGQTSPMFEVGPRTWWVHVVSVEGGESRSLYDPEVQRQLYTELYNRRSAEERERYIKTLLDKGVYDDMDAMRLKLVRIAIVRYAR
jgi:hypothetical protein